MNTAEIKAAIERLQGTEASSAIRRLIWEHARNWKSGTTASPKVVSDREREYAAGAVAAIDELYETLAALLLWRPQPQNSPGNPTGDAS